MLGIEIPAGLGAGDLDRVLDIVCHHRSTARYIAEKLCLRFISDTPPQSAILKTAEAFSQSRGDIPETLLALFSSPEFLATRGSRIKRPFHFVISSLRATAARTDAGPELQSFLLRMGHAPFQYPTPDGYPLEARPWMATLLWRWKFAMDFANHSLKGTSFDEHKLIRHAGGKSATAAHFLGRKPSRQEASALAASGNPTALLIACPAFQIF